MSDDKPHDHGDFWDTADEKWLIRLKREGKTYREMAKYLGRTTAAIGSKLSRLRKKGVYV